LVQASISQILSFEWSSLRLPAVELFGQVAQLVANEIGAASPYSSNATYVNTLRLEVAVISVGKNSFGHPSQTVIDRWDAHAEVFQTQNPADDAMIDGNITITTKGVTTYTATSWVTSGPRQRAPTSTTSPPRK
jgi:hypothetical protein